MIRRNERTEIPQEPVGIVIARGAATDTPPRFAAFIWGPAPEVDAEVASTTKAA